jgi:transposase
LLVRSLAVNFQEVVHSDRTGRQNYAAAARKFSTTPKKVAKWVKRFRAEGLDSVTAPQDLFHRTAKLRKPHATPSKVLRRQRYTARTHVWETWGLWLGPRFAFVGRGSFLSIVGTTTLERCFRTA